MLEGAVVKLEPKTCGQSLNGMLQESGNAKPSATVNSGAMASGKPQKTGASLPGSAFKSLRSMSFKRKPSQGVSASPLTSESLPAFLTYPQCKQLFILISFAISSAVRLEESAGCLLEKCNLTQPYPEQSSLQQDQ